MKTMTSIAFALTLLVAGACSNDKPATSASTPGAAEQHSSKSATLTAEELGELGADIRKNPEEADRILKDRGLTEAEFASAVRKVSESPAESKRYAEAYKRRS